MSGKRTPTRARAPVQRTRRKTASDGRRPSSPQARRAARTASVTRRAPTAKPAAAARPAARGTATSRARRGTKRSLSGTHLRSSRRGPGAKVAVRSVLSQRSAKLVALLGAAERRGGAQARDAARYARRIEFAARRLEALMTAASRGGAFAAGRADVAESILRVHAAAAESFLGIAVEPLRRRAA